MKYLNIPLFLALILGGITLQAQSFREGQVTISPSIMVGTIGFYGGGTGLPLAVSGEYGITEYIGVGPFLGYAGYNYNSGSFKYKWTFFTFGARGDFHFWSLLEDATESDLGADKIDVYAGALLGFRTASYSSNDGVTVGGTSFGSGGTFGLAIGGRYYVSDKVAVFAEAGRILFGSLNIGATIRIK